MLRLEVYFRRQSIRISGMAGFPDEDIKERDVKIFADCGVEVKPEDISEVHRTGQKRNQGIK